MANKRYTVRLDRGGDVETIHGLTWDEADAMMVRAVERDGAEVSWLEESRSVVTAGELERTQIIDGDVDSDVEVTADVEEGSR